MKIVKKTESGYECSECHYVYKEKKWAEKCEAWCKKHKSCNLNITKNAIKKNI